ncbi:hypothetical protein [Anabaena sp. CCY 9614]|uniref:hypothetical protein n=1 Tax=Anabaena sp. CCY 9614 TaxID=3103869 RepID=UPI0039C6F504
MSARPVPVYGKTSSELVQVADSNYYSNFSNLHKIGNCKLNFLFKSLIGKLPNYVIIIIIIKLLSDTIPSGVEFFAKKAQIFAGDQVLVIQVA